MRRRWQNLILKLHSTPFAQNILWEVHCGDCTEPWSVDEITLFHSQALRICFSVLSRISSIENIMLFSLLTTRFIRRKLRRIVSEWRRWEGIWVFQWISLYASICRKRRYCIYAWFSIAGIISNILRIKFFWMRICKPFYLFFCYWLWSWMIRNIMNNIFYVIILS